MKQQYICVCIVYLFTSCARIYQLASNFDGLTMKCEWNFDATLLCKYKHTSTAFSHSKRMQCKMGNFFSSSFRCFDIYCYTCLLWWCLRNIRFYFVPTNIFCNEWRTKNTEKITRTRYHDVKSSIMQAEWWWFFLGNFHMKYSIENVVRGKTHV